MSPRKGAMAGRLGILQQFPRETRLSGLGSQLNKSVRNFTEFYTALRECLESMRVATDIKLNQSKRRYILRHVGNGQRPQIMLNF